MPQFTLDRYDVLLAGEEPQDPPIAHTVTIYHADELLAEKEGSRYGIGLKFDDDGQPDPGSVLGKHLQTMYVWAALTRERKYAKPFPVFMKACLAIQEAEDLVVDPTPEGTTEPSSSATTSHPSDSGSTPPAPAATSA